jgi:hypothetical protein
MCTKLWDRCLPSWHEKLSSTWATATDAPETPHPFTTYTLDSSDAFSSPVPWPEETGAFALEIGDDWAADMLPFFGNSRNEFSWMQSMSPRWYLVPAAGM